MSKENVVSIQMPAKELQTVLKKLQEVKAIMKPYLVALQPSERMRIPKMSDKTLPFVQNANEYAHSHQNYSPPTFSPPNWLST